MDRFITLYRDTVPAGSGSGGFDEFVPGPLRAKLLGIRIPAGLAVWLLGIDSDSVAW